MLEFATATWDGWDYIPHAWPVWLESREGVLLVGVPGSVGGDGAPQDASGDELRVDRPIALARVASASPSEAWLEGIRVHPRVRGMDVATDLQVAELQWAAAIGASVVRYATSSRNEGSHRLGARHGFTVLCNLRTYSRGAETQDHDEDDDTSGFDSHARRLATAARGDLLRGLADEGSVVAAATADTWWERLSADPTFTAAHRLYEHRAWELRELTRDAFDSHIAQAEVVGLHDADDGAWALAILPREALPSEDVSLHLALVCGEPRMAAALAAEAQRLADAPLRFRLPDGAVDDSAFTDAGFLPREWTLDILGRRLDDDHPPPAVDQATLRLADAPSA